MLLNSGNNHQNEMHTQTLFIGDQNVTSNYTPEAICFQFQRLQTK